MSIKIENNAWGRLAASITDTDTTIPLIDASLFPVIAVDEYFFATLINASNELEIVKVTAIVGNDLTVERGAEGTTSRGYSQNDLIEQRVTAQTVYDLFLQNSQDAAAAQAAAEAAQAGAEQAYADALAIVGSLVSLAAAVAAAQAAEAGALAAQGSAETAQAGAEQAELDAQAAQAAAEAAQAAAEAAAALASGGDANYLPQGDFAWDFPSGSGYPNTVPFPFGTVPVADGYVPFLPGWRFMSVGNTIPALNLIEQNQTNPILDASIISAGARGYIGIQWSNIGGSGAYTKVSGIIPAWPRDPLINPSNQVTISFWIKGSVSGQIGVLLKKATFGAIDGSPFEYYVANAVPVTTNWQYLTFTGAYASDDSPVSIYSGARDRHVAVEFFLQNNTTGGAAFGNPLPFLNAYPGEIFLANVQVNRGTAAQPFSVPSLPEKMEFYHRFREFNYLPPSVYLRCDETQTRMYSETIGYQAQKHKAPTFRTTRSDGIGGSYSALISLTDIRPVHSNGPGGLTDRPITIISSGDQEGYQITCSGVGAVVNELYRGRLSISTDIQHPDIGLGYLTIDAQIRSTF